MDKEFLGIIAIPLAIIGICVLYLIVDSYKKKKLCTVQAEVLSKRVKRVNVQRVAKVGASLGSNWFECYAVFRTEKGKKLELQLPDEIYDSINEGDKGQLSFKGYNFISFDKNSCYFMQDSQ